jgi:hypothetical protein
MPFGSCALLILLAKSVLQELAGGQTRLSDSYQTSIVRNSDFASSIKSAQEPGCRDEGCTQAIWLVHGASAEHSLCLAAVLPPVVTNLATISSVFVMCGAVVSPPPCRADRAWCAHRFLGLRKRSYIVARIPPLGIAF